MHDLESSGWRAEDMMDAWISLREFSTCGRAERIGRFEGEEINLRVETMVKFHFRRWDVDGGSELDSVLMKTTEIH